MNDVDRQWSLGANQSGVRQTAGTTATEVAAMERATTTRLSGEQADVTKFWLSLVGTVGQLLQLYADRQSDVEVVGEEGAAALEVWDRQTIRGEFLYSIVPDSADRPDAARDRDLALNAYNLLANSPYVNGKALARDTIEAFGGDPERLLQDPPPPPKEGPRVNFSAKGEDLNPSMPQYVNVTRILAAAGLEQPQPEPSPPQQPGLPFDGEIGPASVVDRERLRMAEADEGDRRAGGLVNTGRQP